MKIVKTKNHTHIEETNIGLYQKDVETLQEQRNIPDSIKDI